MVLLSEKRTLDDRLPYKLLLGKSRICYFGDAMLPDCCMPRDSSKHLTGVLRDRLFWKDMLCPADSAHDDLESIMISTTVVDTIIVCMLESILLFPSELSCSQGTYKGFPRDYHENKPS